MELALQNLENIRRKKCSNWKIAIIFMAVLCVLIGAVTGLAIASNKSDGKYVSSDVIGKYSKNICWRNVSDSEAKSNLEAILIMNFDDLF